MLVRSVQITLMLSSLLLGGSACVRLSDDPESFTCDDGECPSGMKCVDREFESPLPPEAHDLDAVVMVLFYHDLYWMGVDRAAMNRAIRA